MINVIGLGYIGLPTAVMLASKGIDVVGTDINQTLINKLKDGKISFEEKGLKEHFQKARNHLSFNTEPVKTNTYIVAVPTPYNKETKKLDCRYVLNAIENIIMVCEKGSVIVIESTIAPGTIDKTIIPFIEENGFIANKDLYLVHAPERIIPGNIIEELIYNNRVMGTVSEEIGMKVKRLYQSFCQGEITLTSYKMAELSKVVENTYRDINIAYANELAKICDEEKLNVLELIEMVNKHPRVKVLKPGPGVGGHCLAVDPWFLVGEYGKLVPLVETARLVNEGMPKYVFSKLKKIIIKEGIKACEIGIYGLSYKENINDFRESPSLKLIELLKRDGIKEFNVYDPCVDKVIDEQLMDYDEFIRNTKLLVILIGHDHIKEQFIDDKIIYDTKGIIKNAKYRL